MAEDRKKKLKGLSQAYGAFYITNGEIYNANSLNFDLLQN
jgi:hypothetical protein